VKKYDILLVDLNPSRGAEKRGVRPCVVLQNNLANKSRLQTVTIAPITKRLRSAPPTLLIIPSLINLSILLQYPFIPQKLFHPLDIVCKRNKPLFDCSLLLLDRFKNGVGCRFCAAPQRTVQRGSAPVGTVAERAR